MTACARCGWRLLVADLDGDRSCLRCGQVAYAEPPAIQVVRRARVEIAAEGDRRRADAGVQRWPFGQDRCSACKVPGLPHKAKGRCAACYARSRRASEVRTEVC